ncbi:hypothetical protein HELRODRAFT_167868 [Helobdella robusta]|uniref:Axin beta-catenin binding domain-containing protein n=1 Tax=Helobdella robusta TaxID=6412 RepID=T1EZW7_HELRO|nr:hypothetical protein HELRODRAFT_167868 [Helobdella robusta]ESO10031.1 hypothetical protein HELRODRAFT_167868 [Helobdella robusta]
MAQELSPVNFKSDRVSSLIGFSETPHAILQSNSVTPPSTLTSHLSSLSSSSSSSSSSYTSQNRKSTSPRSTYLVTLMASINSDKSDVHINADSILEEHLSRIWEDSGISSSPSPPPSLTDQQLPSLQQPQQFQQMLQNNFLNRLSQNQKYQHQSSHAHNTTSPMSLVSLHYQQQPLQIKTEPLHLTETNKTTNYFSLDGKLYNCNDATIHQKQKFSNLVNINSWVSNTNRDRQIVPQPTSPAWNPKHINGKDLIFNPQLNTFNSISMIKPSMNNFLEDQENISFDNDDDNNNNNNGVGNFNDGNSGFSASTLPSPTSSSQITKPALSSSSQLIKCFWCNSIENVSDCLDLCEGMDVNNSSTEPLSTFNSTQFCNSLNRSSTSPLVSNSKNSTENMSMFLAGDKTSNNSCLGFSKNNSISISNSDNTVNNNYFAFSQIVKSKECNTSLSSPSSHSVATSSSSSSSASFPSSADQHTATPYCCCKNHNLYINGR